MPRAHIDIPNFVIVYATCGANHFGFIHKGGELLMILPPAFDSFRYGIQSFEAINVPRTFTWCMRSYLEQEQYYQENHSHSSVNDGSSILAVAIL